MSLTKLSRPMFSLAMCIGNRENIPHLLPCQEFELILRSVQVNGSTRENADEAAKEGFNKTQVVLTFGTIFLERQREDPDQGNTPQQNAPQTQCFGQWLAKCAAGFDHICGTTRKGEFLVARQTNMKRMRATLRAIKEKLRPNASTDTRAGGPGCEG